LTGVSLLESEFPDRSCLLTNLEASPIATRITIFVGEIFVSELFGAIKSLHKHLTITSMIIMCGRFRAQNNLNLIISRMNVDQSLLKNGQEPRGGFEDGELQN
jgi:hypothetical protein